MRIHGGVISLILISFLAVLPGPLYGGNGTVVAGPPHRLNLYLFYNYDESNMQIMRNAFQEASRLLYNATNGQVQIGVVRVSKKASFSNRADIWILSGAGGASSSVGAMGTPGLHMTLFRERHRWTNNDGPGGNERGQFGIAHESGHYVFQIYDEYDGGVDPHCLEDADSVVGCVMDGGTTVNNTRTEFCSTDGLGLSTDHHPDNEQEDEWGVSCWEHMVSYMLSEYGVTVTQPSAANPPDTAMPAGHQDIAWIVVGDTLRYSLSLDRSYSMIGSKLDLTKVAADLFVDLVHEGESEFLGVTSFSNAAIENFPMTEVTGAAVKEDARDAIGLIEVENNTAIGDGLRASLNQITGNGTVPVDDDNIETIVLLSDGVHNAGEDPATVLTDIRSRGARVFTIGMGDPAAGVYPLDETTLQEIADEAGGLYRHAEDETGLPAIYAEYSAEVRGDAVSSEETESLPAGGEAGAAELPAFIDSFTREATFILHWPAGEGYFDLKLRRPDGSLVDPGTAAADPKITYLEQPLYEFYRVSEPVTGTWTLIVGAAPNGGTLLRANVQNLGERRATLTVPVRPRFTTQVLSSAPGVDFVVDLDDFVLRYPDSPILRASVFANVPVAGASVTGVVTGPKGLSKNIELYDDGQRSHGDVQAADGVYSNRFLDFPVNGGYTVRLLVENKNGVEAVPDEVMPAGWTPQPIAPFTRVSRGRFVIQGVPAELTTPEIAKVTPGQGRYGSVVDVTIRGDHFVDGANVLFSNPDLVVKSIRRVSANEMAVRLQVRDVVADPYSDVTVVNPGGMAAVAPKAFRAVGSLYPFGWSLHAGVARPSGSFDSSYDPGPSLAADLEYRFAESFALELLAGYHSFAGDGVSDTYWMNLTLDLRYYLPNPKWLFLDAGIGAYFPEKGSTEFGWMIGGGGHWPLTSSLSLEITYNDHTISTPGSDTSFSTLWGGLKYRF